jgi:hypothetical protein
MYSLPRSNLTEPATDVARRLVVLEQANRRLRRSAGLLCGVLALGVVAGLGGLKAAPQQPDEPNLKSDEPADPSKIDVDDHDVLGAYSNFCRVSGTPEEVILDFGLNPRPSTPGNQQVRATHKIVLSYYTAKRLAAALVMSIQRHERTYGPIELDVRKRMQSSKPADPGT